MTRPLRRVAALAVAIVAAALVTVAPGTAGAQPPAVRPDNRPSPTPGHENGLLPPDLLITVAPGCRVDRAAGPSLRLLLDSAEAHGVALGTRSCYRPLADQIRVLGQWTARGNSACAAATPRDPSGRVVGTSIHGWGKAVDFSNGAAPMTFGSVGFRFLSEHAARLGWNHPAFARPGGSACPEPWHWEWVGDGGRLGAPPVPADAVALVPADDGRGYAVVSGLGAVRHHGSSADRGSAAGIPLAWVVVGGAGRAGPGGYWLVGADGGVFSFGAPFHGSTGGMRLNRPVVDLAAGPGSQGYWLVAGDGGVFSFDAPFHGSTGGMRLNRPVVSMASTPSGQGYWLVATDGGVFAFGDARFHGSTGAMRLAEPVVAMAATPTGGGYWLAAADGGVFAFGDAGFHGSAAGAGLAAPVVDVAPTPHGEGYWLLAADGTVLAFGDARLFPAR